MVETPQPRGLSTCPRCAAPASEGGQYCGVCGAHLQIASANDPLVGVILADRYRLVSLIGSSALGYVYQAEHVGMGKVVVVKLIRVEAGAEEEDVGDLFLTEFRDVANLTSMHTAENLDFGRDGANVYTVTEFFRGRDLGRLVQEGGPLESGRALRLMAQVCQALAEAHDMGIVHGRLKPENVMVTRTHEGGDFAHVLDFGYRRLAEVDDEHSLSTARRLPGSPHCIAPEQVRGGRVDGRTDLYSVGALLYWLITGTHAFTAKTPVGVLMQHLKQRPQPPSERRSEVFVPPPVDLVVLKALEKDAERRPKTADDLRADLLRAAASP